MKKKKPDQHKSKNMVRLGDDLHEVIRRLAETNQRSITGEIRLAVIAHLKHAGVWPPK